MNRRSIFQFAAVAACALSVSMVRGAPSSIRMVTNTADAGPGSLREAIVWADIHPGTVIRFKIPSETAAGRGSLPIIKPLSPLPIISGARTVIDGTAPATAGPVKRITPGVVINGAQIAPKACGLHLEAAQCVIKGLVINGFSGSGIELFGPHTSENRVEGCFIGTDPTGDRGDGNRSHGIDIALGANHNAIGGTAPGAGNVVSGNGDRGVKLFGAGADDNVVEGNIIGANAAGDAAVMNGKNGVDIDGGAKNNIIGGAAPGARNIISGNGERGVLIASPGTNSNSVAGNFIGTNAAGTAAIPNHAYGIDIEGMSQLNTIGGATPGARNLISGNTQAGVKIYGFETMFNEITGNYIGTDVSGTRPLGNGDNGVDIAGGAGRNTVGGSQPGEANRIAFNGADGMRVYDAGTKDNTLEGNDVYANARLGIEWADGAADRNSHLNNHFAGPFLTRARTSTRPTAAPHNKRAHREH